LASDILLMTIALVC